MKIDIDKTLSKSPKERVLVLINHQAEISLGFDGFLSGQDMTDLVDSFRTDRENQIYSKHRELFRKVQQFLVNINQIHLIYKEELQEIDKRIIIQQSIDEFNTIKQAILLSKDDESKNKAIELIDNSIILRLEREVIRGMDWDKIITNNLYIIKKRQINLKSGIQAFKDALKDHSLRITAFTKKIASIEKQHNQAFKELYFNPSLISEVDYNSVKIDPVQYNSFRESFL